MESVLQRRHAQKVWDDIVATEDGELSLEEWRRYMTTVHRTHAERAAVFGVVAAQLALLHAGACPILLYKSPAALPRSSMPVNM